MEAVIIIFVAIVIATIGVITYDYYKYGKSYYYRTIIILRVNNERIRNTIKAVGIDLCWCTVTEGNNFLQVSTDMCVHGFNEERDHLISESERNNIKIIDCGVSVKRFIYEIQNLKK